MIGNFDTASDCTDVVDLAWAEMDEFFKALGARGPAATPEQWEQDCARFLEIQERCNALVLESCDGPNPAILGHIRPQGRENSMSDNEVPGDDEWLRTVANSLLQRIPSDRDRALRVIGHLCELVQPQ